jgi:hypothetical protein
MASCVHALAAKFIETSETTEKGADADGGNEINKPTKRTPHLIFTVICQWHKTVICQWHKREGSYVLYEAYSTSISV